jgi:hypothetical protein
MRVPGRRVRGGNLPQRDRRGQAVPRFAATGDGTLGASGRISAIQ